MSEHDPRPGPAGAPATPDEAAGSWSDLLAARLRAQRVVMLSGRLDGESAQRASAELMLLDAEGEGSVRLLLSCPDADLDAALVLAETVSLTGAPVHAVARGAVGGPAVAVLAAADRRTVDPHAMLWLREPRASAEGRADELASAAQQHERQRGHLHDLLARATGRPLEEIAETLREGRTLDAAGAVSFGLAHGVAGSDGP